MQMPMPKKEPVVIPRRSSPVSMTAEEAAAGTSSAANNTPDYNALPTAVWFQGGALGGRVAKSGIGPGMVAYQKFERVWLKLDTTLSHLENRFGAISSGGSAVKAMVDTKSVFKDITYLYSRNLSFLFPRERIPMPFVKDDPDTFGYDRVDHIDTFKWLSASCRNLRETMDMYKGVYYHEGLMKLLENIENQSQHAADILSSHEESDLQSFSMPHVRNTLHDTFVVVSEDMCVLEGTLHEFLVEGIPRVRSAEQEHDDFKSLNTTTISTFLAGVTATMIQFTFPLNGTPANVAVNALLFASLLFSTASTMHGLLVVALRQSLQRPLEYFLPKWGKYWLMRGPMIYVIVAGLQFFLAVMLFVFCSGQSMFTRMLSTVFAAAHTVAFAFLISWIILGQHLAQEGPRAHDSWRSRLANAMLTSTWRTDQDKKRPPSKRSYSAMFVRMMSKRRQSTAPGSKQTRNTTSFDQPITIDVISGTVETEMTGQDASPTQSIKWVMPQPMLGESSRMPQPRI